MCSNVLEASDRICEQARLSAWRDSTTLKSLEWRCNPDTHAIECHERRSDASSRVIGVVTEYADTFAGPCMHCGADLTSSVAPYGLWCCSEECGFELDAALGITCVHCGETRATHRDEHGNASCNVCVPRDSDTLPCPPLTELAAAE